MKLHEELRGHEAAVRQLLSLKPGDEQVNMGHRHGVGQASLPCASCARSTSSICSNQSMSTDTGSVRFLIDTLTLGRLVHLSSSIMDSLLDYRPDGVKRCLSEQGKAERKPSAKC